jgi:hypothetical protein
MAGIMPGARHRRLPLKVCHAIDADARAFYARHGFVESPTQELTMMIGLRR